jgi:hypothetical protein
MFRMRQPFQGSLARIASHADRGVAQATQPMRRRFAALSDAGPAGRQEALWAKLLAERPDALSDIMTFVRGARHGIADPPLRAGARPDDP